MKPHKWAKEIKAWADGAEIESRFKKSFGRWTDWIIAVPMFHIETDEIEYRIKPQPKEPQYLKIYGWLENGNVSLCAKPDYPYIGKIKLEVDDVE